MDERDLMNAVATPGNKDQRRGAVANIMQRSVSTGALRMTRVLTQPEPARTWAMEVLTNRADTADREWDAADGTQIRVLFGADLRWKYGTIRRTPAPNVSRVEPLMLSHRKGDVADLPVLRAAMLLPRHGAGLESAHGVQPRHAVALEIGMIGADGVFSRTVSADDENEFRSRWGLPALPDAPPPDPAEPVRRGPGRPRLSPAADP